MTVRDIQFVTSHGHFSLPDNDTRRKSNHFCLFNRPSSHTMETISSSYPFKLSQSTNLIRENSPIIRIRVPQKTPVIHYLVYTDTDHIIYYIILVRYYVYGLLINSYTMLIYILFSPFYVIRILILFRDHQRDFQNLVLLRTLSRNIFQ